MLDLTEDVRRARELAGQMTGWLASGDLADAIDPRPVPGKTVHGSDLVEWCRSARDMLERFAEGEPEGRFITGSDGVPYGPFTP